MTEETEEWNLDGIVVPPGISFYSHARGLLSSSGRGPLLNGGEPLPDEPPRDLRKLMWSAGSRDAILSTRSNDDFADHIAALAVDVRSLLLVQPSQEIVHRVLELFSIIQSPKELDQFLKALVGGEGVRRSRLATFGRWICKNGTSRNTVKLGIALLGTSGRNDDVDLLVNLGLLEELTLYSVVALRNILESPDEAVFDLAQQVEGWGRIQAIRALNGSLNPQIQSWLIRGGAENDVMLEEVAYIAATTGHLVEALENDSDDELLDHAGELLKALAEGGPSKDMRDFVEGTHALRLYVGHMEVADVNVARLTAVAMLSMYLDNGAAENRNISEADRQALAKRYRALLHQTTWVDYVKRLLHSSDLRDVKSVIAVAKPLGVEVRQTILRWLDVNRDDVYLWQELLRADSNEELRADIVLVQEYVPLSRLARGPALELGLGGEYRFEDILGQFLQHLRDLPGEGWPLVSVAMRSSVIRNRSHAIRILETWPRLDWPKDTPQQLLQLLQDEPDPKLRTRIEQLLSNSADNWNRN